MHGHVLCRWSSIKTSQKFISNPRVCVKQASLLGRSLQSLQPYYVLVFYIQNSGCIHIYTYYAQTTQIKLHIFKEWIRWNGSCTIKKTAVVLTCHDAMYCNLLLEVTEWQILKVENVGNCFYSKKIPADRFKILLMMLAAKRCQAEELSNKSNSWFVILSNAKRQPNNSGLLLE